MDVGMSVLKLANGGSEAVLSSRWITAAEALRELEGVLWHPRAISGGLRWRTRTRLIATERPFGKSPEVVCDGKPVQRARVRERPHLPSDVGVTFHDCGPELRPDTMSFGADVLDAI